MNTAEKELFNRVKAHLLEQGERAHRASQLEGFDHYKCWYHLPSGLKCAVGCLITDELYHPDMEGSTIVDEPLYSGLIDSGIDMGGKAVSILRKLQNVHDHVDPSEWSEAIDRVEVQLMRKRIAL